MEGVLEVATGKKGRQWFCGHRCVSAVAKPAGEEGRSISCELISVEMLLRSVLLLSAQGRRNGRERERSGDRRVGRAKGMAAVVSWLCCWLREKKL